MSTSESGQPIEMTPTGHMPNLEAQLLTKAIQDPAFREKLVSDPKAVLAEAGLNVPDDVQINVLQESSTQYYLVLPALEAPAEASAELSDEELEAVAGGANLDSINKNWTGCASGQSGCVATNGCSIAAVVGSAIGAVAVAAGGAVTAVVTGGATSPLVAVGAAGVAGACGIGQAAVSTYK